MADEKTIIMPDNQNSGWGNIPAVLALNGLGYGNNYPPYAYGNGGLFGGNGSGFLSIWIKYLRTHTSLDSTVRCSKDRGGGCAKPRAVRYDDPR